MPSLVAYTVVAVDAFRGRLHRGRCGCLPWSPRLEWLPRMLSVVTSTAVFRGRLHCGRRGCLLWSPWMLSLVASTVIAVVAEIGDHVVKVVWLPRMLSDVTSTAVASTLVVVASTVVAVNAFLGRLHLVDSTVVAADADDSDRFTVPGPPSFAFAVLSTLPWSPISNLYRNPDQSGESYFPQNFLSTKFPIRERRELLSTNFSFYRISNQRAERVTLRRIFF